MEEEKKKVIGMRAFYERIVDLDRISNLLASQPLEKEKPKWIEDAIKEAYTSFQIFERDMGIRFPQAEKEWEDLITCVRDKERTLLECSLIAKKAKDKLLREPI